MQGTCNPDWRPIVWPDKTQSKLRTLNIVNVQVYANTHHQGQSQRPTPGYITLQHSTALPASVTDSIAVAPDQDGQQHFQPRQNQHAEDLPNGYHTDEQQSQVQSKDVSPNKPASVEHQPDPDDPDGFKQVADVEQAPPGMSGQSLIMTAEVNLDELHVFHQDLTALDVCLPPNTLVFELTEGLCLFPSLNLGSGASDLAPLADEATASVPTIPSGVPAQGQSSAIDAVPATSLLSEQVY